jgi:hypothetical protein
MIEKFFVILFVVSFFQHARAEHNTSAAPTDSRVISVFGMAGKDYSNIEIMGVHDEQEKSACIEEFRKNPVFRIASIAKNGKQLQERKFDMVTVNKGKGGGLTHSKNFILLEGKEFCIHLKPAEGVDRVQLFRGKNLLIDTEVKPK